MDYFAKFALNDDDLLWLGILHKIYIYWSGQVLNLLCSRIVFNNMKLTYKIIKNWLKIQNS